ncbi:MAG: hypothetical protein U0K28_00480, partial [Prevotellamassilia sp.]|nr:hypothetical protein [Prevotellamassilia sp.]
MITLNENFLKLQKNYLFADIAQKVAAYQQAHPEAPVIRMGIGDVTRPLAPAVIEALHRAVDEMGSAETFRGYGPEHVIDATPDNGFDPHGSNMSTVEDAAAATGKALKVANES